MQIQHIEKKHLPPLACAAYVCGDKISVLHGSAVECHENCFVEGAWCGNFREMDFISADWFCGTGACINEDSIVFSTPTHVTYGLYSVNVTMGYCISNSIYFLMALENLHYDTDYANYEVDFNTVLDGINRYKETVGVLDDEGRQKNIRIAYFKTIAINNLGEYKVKNKEAVQPFTCFEDYYCRLLDDMKKMVENATDPSRRHTYGMITTISRGYDAPCCAAIAKKIGCETAITFQAKGKYKEDCGVDVAKAMGYKNVIEVDANEYISRIDLVEAEYICSGELGAQIAFSSFDNYIKGNICFTGERGDSIWGRFSDNRNNEFAFNDMLSHLGSCERRLWLNYISVPMPLYGATSWTSIYDISNSEEMRPWCINNDYDRPIPRRIVEQAGVKREQFGMRKHGAGFVYKFDWLKRILSRMSPTTADSFKKFVKEHKKVRILESMMFFWKLRGTYLHRLGIKVETLSVKDYSKISNPMAASLLIPWSGEIMAKKYKQVLERKTK